VGKLNFNVADTEKKPLVAKAWLTSLFGYASFAKTVHENNCSIEMCSKIDCAYFNQFLVSFLNTE